MNRVFVALALVLVLVPVGLAQPQASDPVGDVVTAAGGVPCDAPSVDIVGIDVSYPSFLQARVVLRLADLDNRAPTCGGLAIPTTARYYQLDIAADREFKTCTLTIAEGPEVAPGTLPAALARGDGCVPTEGSFVRSGNSLILDLPSRHPESIVRVTATTTLSVGAKGLYTTGYAMDSAVASGF